MMSKVYTEIGGEFGGALPKEKIDSMIARFPEGQICITDRGRVVGAALSLIVDYDRFGDRHTYASITGEATFRTHDPKGDVLYGADVFVDPEYRDLRLGRRLYDARKELCRKLNLRAIIAGGRIPGYQACADRMSVHEYVNRVRLKQLHDPILSFQLANDFQVRRILRGYMPGDQESFGYATLIQWDNVAYESEPKPIVGAEKSRVRIGAVQWQLRPVSSVDDLLTQVEFYVAAVASYQGDFVVFPEFFSVALLALTDEPNAARAMRKLAGFTPAIADAMARMAVRHNINIVGGSMPVQQGDNLHNVAFLFQRDGSQGSQPKIHVTPIERRAWALEGGSTLRYFDTDAGRVGILVCYDIEFPELGRILAEKGVDILFVPSWTETKNGYQRVRRCAQARAIENECYVVVSGSVGNLPGVDYVNVHYSQTAIFCPSDFVFPHDAVVAESTPNTETVLTADVDIERLHEVRKSGSVRNLADRRGDLYQVVWRGLAVD